MTEPHADRMEALDARRALGLVRALRAELGEGREEAIRALAGIERLLADISRSPGALDRTALAALFTRLQWFRSIFPHDGG